MHDKTLLMALYKRLTDGAIDLDKFYQLVARVVVDALGGSRASVWLFQGTLRDCLLCQSMYDKTSTQWSAGALMHEDDCGDYFRALLDVKLIAAGDAVIIFRLIAPQKEVALGYTYPFDDAIINEGAIERVSDSFNFFLFYFVNGFIVTGFPYKRLPIGFIYHGAV